MGQMWFVPPRRSDDNAPFDLWVGDGNFRSMTEDELAWARTTTGCVGILQGSPFIILEGAFDPQPARTTVVFVAVVVVSVAGVSVGGWSGRRG
jgi:hypothetical protein